MKKITKEMVNEICGHATMYTSPGGRYIGKALKRLFVEGVLHGLGMAGYETHDQSKRKQLTEEILKRIS